MSDLFRDQIWTFVGAAFAGIAVVICVLFYFLQRRKKGLGYKVLWQLPLVMIHNELKDGGQLTILFNGKLVKDIHLLLVEIVNTGNVPIAGGDYERPLSIRCGSNSTILSAEVVSTFPENLDPNLSISRNAIDIEPLLLNPGDRFVVKSIVRDFREDVVAVTRVIGVDGIKYIGPQPKQRTGKYYSILGFGIMFGAIVIPKFKFEIFGLFYSSYALSVSMILIGLALSFYGAKPVSYWKHLLAKRR